jgi:protein SCO1/2
MMNRRDLLTCGLTDKSRPIASMGAEFYTNAVLHTHDNKPVKFYDDLIKGKLVAINFIYTGCQKSCPRSTGNLQKAQQLLGSRVGRDIFMYTLTLKPEEDDPEVLKSYAQSHGAKPGWLFLTGNEYDLTTIRFKLLRWDHPMLDFDLDQHTGMVRIINDSLNLWTMCPTHATPQQIVEAVSWVEPTKPLNVRIRENFVKQAKIDRETREAEARGAWRA